MTDGARKTDSRGRTGLTPAVFQILLALADGDRHGYAIMKEVERRTEGEVTLRPGTLYRAVTRLLDDGWIGETDGSDVAEGDDERRKYYMLTPAGREHARQEALRLAALVRSARAKNLVEDADLA